MAYNRWLSTEYLAHHGVKGQKWGERNGPPYPLDSSISTGSKLIKGDGSPQGKKKYKTSEKTAHKRAERKARTDRELEDAKKRLRELGISKDGIDEFELWSMEVPEKERSKWMQDMVTSTARKSKIKSARDNDMYDLDFLESVQNEHWYNDKKRMLKEYSDYLQDRDAYAQRGLAPKVTAATTQASEPAKKQGSKLEAFKDRLFGNKKSEPQKTYTSPEPVKSEKARTKRGEEYEINDWNGNGADTIREFKRNPESHIRIARKAAISEARRLFESYAKDIPEANNALKLSDAEFSKRIKLDFADPFDRGTMVFTFGDAHGDFTGHTIDVEYDLVRRRVVGTSVNG